MNKFDARWNKTVGKGSGKCHDCGGTGKNGNCTCCGCHGTGVCSRCDGTGISDSCGKDDPHNCVWCSNNWSRFYNSEDTFWLNRLIYGDDFFRHLK